MNIGSILKYTFAFGLFMFLLYSNFLWVTNNLVNRVILIGIYLIPVLYYWKFRKVDFKVLSKMNSKVLLTFAMSIGLFLLGYVVNYLQALMIFGHQNLVLKGYEFLSFENVLFSIILLPISEELFFRGLILKKIMSHASIVVSVIISSVMFSLAHVFSEGSFFVALLSGFYLGMIYVRTKDVKVCILVHVFYNLLVLLFSDKFNILMLELNRSSELIILCIVFILSSLLLIATYRKSKLIREN